jgi:hypothetical protein
LELCKAFGEGVGGAKPAPCVFKGGELNGDKGAAGA